MVPFCENANFIILTEIAFLGVMKTEKSNTCASSYYEEPGICLKAFTV
jgi:hypothetical protein